VQLDLMVWEWTERAVRIGSWSLEHCRRRDVIVLAGDLKCVGGWLMVGRGLTASFLLLKRFERKRMGEVLEVPMEGRVGKGV